MGIHTQQIYVAQKLQRSRERQLLETPSIEDHIRGPGNKNAYLESNSIVNRIRTNLQDLRC